MKNNLPEINVKKRKAGFWNHPLCPLTINVVLILILTYYVRDFENMLMYFGGVNMFCGYMGLRLSIVIDESRISRYLTKKGVKGLNNKESNFNFWGCWSLGLFLAFIPGALW